MKGGLGQGGNIEEVQISEGKGAHSVLAVEFEAIITLFMLSVKHPFLLLFFSFWLILIPKIQQSFELLVLPPLHCLHVFISFLRSLNTAVTIIPA